MKKIIVYVTATITMLSLSAPVVAQNPEKQTQKDAMQMDTRQGMGSTGMMMQNMQKMNKQMEEINATSDPAKRKRLMHEHMQSMKEIMQMMRSMGGGMMMGMMSGKQGSGERMNKEMGKCMDKYGKGQRHEMMEQRMDMMQMMMEQMMGQMMAQEGMMKNME